MTAVRSPAPATTRTPLLSALQRRQKFSRIFEHCEDEPMVVLIRSEPSSYQKRRHALTASEKQLDAIGCCSILLDNLAATAEFVCVYNGLHAARIAVDADGRMQVWGGFGPELPEALTLLAQIYADYREATR